MQTTQSPVAPAINRLRDKIIGCWLGKAVGGTLGMPYEGHDGPLNLSFYNPVPREMLPNDDLDLQVVWACVLDKLSHVTVDRHILAQAWLDHVEFPWDEYGVAIRNLKLGLKAPLSGEYDNFFVNAMGAPIRSEIWACLAPGNPALAAAYAYEDGCVDHCGDGVWAEMFLAALESAAFVETDPDRLLDSALTTLPAESATRRAVADTRVWYKELGDWKAVRERILQKYGSDNFTYAPMNIAFTVLGWLASEGDFSEAICIAVNCGKDTDCTGATAGALMGILDPDGIPERWLAPIGRSLVLSPGIVNLSAPGSLDEFTDLVINVAGRLAGRLPSPRHYEQSAEGLAFKVQRAFADEFPVQDTAPILGDATTVELSGNFARLSGTDFEKNTLLLRYEFVLDQTAPTIVMVNTPARSRVWLDGAFAFGRDGGAMVPSPHRAPKDQLTNRPLDAGKHEFIVAIEKPANGGGVEWVAAVADGKTAIWHPRAFLGGGR
ncbi:MAG: ADP-ribosylglycohydrolase family protein [Capsulimonadaceae bacterium]|nr:ADP-ribosylglycohydrolase family protein [Capsulimonadaceae bacterium]